MGIEKLTKKNKNSCDEIRNYISEDNINGINQVLKDVQKFLSKCSILVSKNIIKLQREKDEKKCDSLGKIDSKILKTQHNPQKLSNIKQSEKGVSIE